MIIIVVVGVNDNRVMLETRNLLLVLTEGMTEVRVGQEAIVVVVDADGEISSLQVTLSNRLDQLEEIRIANSNSIGGNGTYIFINDTMSIGAYQVRNVLYL